MKIIDFHTHAFADDIAERAIKKIEENSNSKAFLDGTLKGLLGSMENAGIDISVILPVSTKPTQVEAINRWTSEIQCDSIISFGTIYPSAENSVKLPAMLKRMNLRGVKFHADYQNFKPDEEYMFYIYEEMIKNELITFYHSGKDVGIKTPPLGTPKIFAKILEKFPEMKMVLAHTGGFRLWDDVEYYLVGSPAFFDISYTIGVININQFSRIIKNHGIDKILFGTDSPWRDQKKEIENIMNLPISMEDKENIFFKNAEKLLNL
ncbi:MAG: amidohydrolase family protein [Candidatus Helarchaeota archaeon]|nr:amidohydrolase family protein [Candidatus Helarchaeota archaeon]